MRTVEETAVKWYYKGTLEAPNPKLRRWEEKLALGAYKVQESDSPYGPWVDSEMRDDGSVHRQKRYMRLELKNGVMRGNERVH